MFNHTDCLLQGESQEIERTETLKLWGTVNIMCNKKKNYLRVLVSFDCAISISQWIQYNGDQHFRLWMLLFCFFLLLKMLIVSVPNTTHVRNDHLRTSSNYSHGSLLIALRVCKDIYPVPISICSGCLGNCQPKCAAPSARHWSLTLCICGVTSSGMATSHKQWEGVLHGEVHPRNLIQKERKWPVSAGWIWWPSGAWNQACVFCSYIGGLRDCLTATMSCAASAWGSTKNIVVLSGIVPWWVVGYSGVARPVCKYQFILTYTVADMLYCIMYILTLHSIPFHCIALHCVALHYITLRYITLHTYITYIIYMYI